MATSQPSPLPSPGAQDTHSPQPAPWAPLFPAEHPPFPVPRWQSVVPGPVGSLTALERVSHVHGHGCTVLAAHVLTHRDTRPGRQVLAAHACATTYVPHTSPGSHLGPGAGSGPGYSLLETMSCFSPRPRGPGSPAKPLPWVVGEVTCPPCLSFPSDTQHVPRMAGQSVCPP